MKRFVLVIIALSLSACGLAGLRLTPAPTPTTTLIPAFIATPQAARAGAEATRSAGESQMLELQVQGTIIAMQMTAAVATEQAFERQTQQVLEATQVASQWTAEAAATGTAAAQAYAQTSTTVAIAAAQTGTAAAFEATSQAQLTLDARATQSAALAQTATAWPVTATPLAATQAAIIASVRETENRSYWRQFVIPFWVLIGAICLTVFLVLVVLAYRRLLPVLELRARTIVSPDGELVTYLPAAQAVKTMLPRRSLAPVLRSGPVNSTIEGLPADLTLQDRLTARSQAINLAHTLAARERSNSQAARRALEAGAAPNIRVLPPEQLAAPLPAVAPWSLLEGWQGQTIPLGVGQAGPVLIDPLVTPHLLISATTGGGKTMCALRPLTAQALAQGQRVILLNDAGGDFAPFMGHPNLTTTEEEPEAIVDVLETVADKVKCRSKILRVAGVSTWNRLTDGRATGEQAEITVVIDELVALAIQAKPAISRRIWSAVILITSKGRKMGIRLIAATTDPTYKTLGDEGLVVRGNCGRVSFHVRDRSTSQAMFDSPGAETLGENQFMALLDERSIRGVAFHPTDEQLATYLARRPVPQLPAWQPAIKIIVPGQAARDWQTEAREMYANGESIGAICRALFGYTGGSAYGKVKAAVEEVIPGNTTAITTE